MGVTAWSSALFPAESQGMSSFGVLAMRGPTVGHRSAHKVLLSFLGVGEADTRKGDADVSPTRNIGVDHDRAGIRDRYMRQSGTCR